MPPPREPCPVMALPEMVLLAMTWALEVTSVRNSPPPSVKPPVAVLSVIALSTSVRVPATRIPAPFRYRLSGPLRRHPCRCDFQRSSETRDLADRWVAQLPAILPMLTLMTRARPVGSSTTTVRSSWIHHPLASQNRRLPIASGPRSSADRGPRGRAGPTRLRLRRASSRARLCHRVAVLVCPRRRGIPRGLPWCRHLRSSTQVAPRRCRSLADDDDRPRRQSVSSAMFSYDVAGLGQRGNRAVGLGGVGCGDSSGPCVVAIPGHIEMDRFRAATTCKRPGERRRFRRGA